MNARELLEKYQVLLAENRSLRRENETLKARLGIVEQPPPNPPQDRENSLPLEFAVQEPPEKNPLPVSSPYLDPTEKIRLFMSLFKGREDVYAKRWQSREGRAGYAPVCRNEWKSGRCRKPVAKCFDCPHQAYDVLTERVIEAHQKGGISQRGLNSLKRLAAFRNPEFYKAQALRLPTYDKPRVISCSEETPAYLCLPRGCATDVEVLLAEAICDQKIIWYGSINLLSFGPRGRERHAPRKP